MTTTTEAQTLSFAANEQQLLHLVTNAMYSNAEIFLRELISNASDAADKLRYMALTSSELYEGDSDLAIRINIDKEAKTLTISDNGVGMTMDEVIEHLGTIAQSGTKTFRDGLSGDSSTDSQLIGQFGVGFYSAFIVADRVIVRTRKAGADSTQGVQWESDGKSQYQVEPISRSTRGTDIILHIKEDSAEFLDDYRLRGIINKYSDHIMLPIFMDKIETPAENKDGEEDSSDEIVVPEQEQVNRGSALWTRDDVSDEDYKELYKHISHDFEDPLTWTRNRVEGSTAYTNLLYIPGRAPFDLWDRDAVRGLKLYVNRVFIMDDAEHCLPNYLRFVKGVVDSNDLPLNISRELLQNDRTIKKIRSGCVRKILSILEQMAENDAEKYEKFWDLFGNVIKEGPGEDQSNKDKIAKLLRFASTNQSGAKQSVTLQDYVSRMKDGQDKIYYLISDTHTAGSTSPLLEVFKQKGIEVLLMSDRVDEWLMAHMTEFDGKTFQSIAKGSLDVDSLAGEKEQSEDQKQEKEEKKKEIEKTFETVLSALAKSLGERVKEVRLSDRLTNSPACVVFADNELSGHMMRMLQAAGQDVPESKPILEINPTHPLCVRLQSLNEDGISPWAELLLGQALLAEGETLSNPSDFVATLNGLLMTS